jgi:osomolarity two-component system response regulator SKN7
MFSILDVLPYLPSVGMNDVLPKPFTKEGMLRALEKHLPQFKKNAPYPPASSQMPHPGGFATPNPAQQPPLGLNMAPLSTAQSLKDETSPGKSPATATSWHSPNQITGASPINASGNYMQQPLADSRQYTITPTHAHTQSGFPAPPNQSMSAPRSGPHRRVMADMTSGPPDDHPEKRQRMYPPPPQGAFP